MAAELPILACSLDAEGAREQAGRYASLGAHGAAVDRGELSVAVAFDDSVDVSVVDALRVIARALGA